MTPPLQVGHEGLLSEMRERVGWGAMIRGQHSANRLINCSSLGRADVGEPDSKRPRLMGMAMGGPPGMMYPAVMPGMAPPPVMQAGMPPQIMPGMAPPMMMQPPPRVQ